MIKPNFTNPVKSLRWCLVLLLLAFVLPSHAEVGIAIVRDGNGQDPNLELEKLLSAELLSLTGAEFDIKFYEFNGNWSPRGIATAYEQAYQSPKIDMVLATGIGSNQYGMSLKQYSKPTFLPFVFDVDLASHETAGTSSGVKNLSYLGDRVNFSENLKSLKKLVNFERIIIVVDEIIIQTVPDIAELTQAALTTNEIEVSYAPYNNGYPELPEIHPAKDLIMLSAVGRLDQKQIQSLINRINQLKVPSFSLQGRDLVKLGVLASDSAETDWVRTARRNALNMQAVLLGQAAETLSTQFESRREFTINMATASAIGVSPSFDLLLEAVLINEDTASYRTLTILEAMQRAATMNLDLIAEQIGLSANRETIAEARSNFLPQLTLNGAYQQNKVSALVQAGQSAERLTNGQVSLNQSLYSDDAWTNYDIQKKLQAVQEKGFDGNRLDVIRDSAVAYLNVLRSKTQVHILKDNLNLTRENLILAEQRVKVGATSSSDLYRWQSKLATARSDLQFSQVQLLQARESLNQLLNFPLTEQISLDAISLDNNRSNSEQEFSELVQTPRQFDFFVEYYVALALDNSPELKQVRIQQQIKKRQIQNLKRSRWLPNVTLSATGSDVLNDSGAGSENFKPNSDWSASVTASLPISTGGKTRSNIRKSLLELNQLEISEQSLIQKISQRFRASAHKVKASSSNIALSNESAEAGEKNLKLISNSYAQGAVSIVELLDAQNASIQASEAAANARFNFLIDLMDAQRAAGEFSFLSSKDPVPLDAEVKAYIALRSQEEGLR